jgi:phosphatidylserine decarboxylase
MFHSLKNRGPLSVKNLDKSSLPYIEFSKGIKNHMTITSYGKKELTVCGLIGAVAAAILITVAIMTELWWVYFFCILPAGLVGFSFFFFRDPRRTVPRDTSVVVAPADGKITEITEVQENSYLNTNARKLGIFLSLLNVHLNRAPYCGTVEYIKYQPGKFLNAGDPRSSEVNESNAIGIVTNKCKMLMRQISGILARRIVCKVNEGDQVDTGEKIGMIKFGSRTELYVPLDARFELQVEVGQKVKAGETIIGVFHTEDTE